MYPHAYRDHWVAQQYLPQSLQGKVFFQPSDQGYEKNIRDRVTRLREAQIEAIAEQESPDPFDMLAYSSASGQGSARDLWVKRTGSQYGNQLSEIRDTLLTLASIKHDDLVLDLHARTGLLSAEACRLTREGGVWALAYNKSEYDILVKSLSAGNPLCNPQVVLTSADAFNVNIRSIAGDKVRFSAIMGRNILAMQNDKSVIVEKAVGLLDSKAKIVLAETVARHGQRISELLKFGQKESKMEKRFRDVEDGLFNNTADNMLNWDEDTLKTILEKIPGVTVRVFTTANIHETRILPSNIEFWFRTSAEKKRVSLGDRLRMEFNETEFERLKTFFHAQLDNQNVNWKTVIAYLKITRE
jgi:putative ATPase